MTERTKRWGFWALLIGTLLYFSNRTSRVRINNAARTIAGWGQEILGVGWDAIRLIGPPILILIGFGLTIHLSMLGLAIYNWLWGSSDAAYIWFIVSSVYACVLIAIIYGKERPEQPGDGPVRRLKTSFHDGLVGLVMLINLISWAVGLFYLTSLTGWFDPQIRTFLILGLTASIAMITIAFCKRWRPGLIVLLAIQMTPAAAIAFVPSLRTLGNVDIYITTLPVEDHYASSGLPNSKSVPPGTIIEVDFQNKIPAGNSLAWKCVNQKTREVYWLTLDFGDNYRPYKPPKPKQGKG